VIILLIWRRKGFIIATLVSTLVGTFTAGISLVDKVQEKRDKHKQKGIDNGQNARIKALSDKVDQLALQDKDDARSSRSSSRSRRRRYEDEEEFAYGAKRARAMIEQAYADNFLRVGQDYARGDLVTENKLQGQIIQLHQTVISVLQEALYDGRQLSQDEIHRLIIAQQDARDGSLEALQGQYKRMLGRSRRRTEDDLMMVEDKPRPLQKQLTFPMRRVSLRDSIDSPRAVKALPAPGRSLFCRYSDDLQHSGRALSQAFDATGDGRCPACEVVLPLEKGDSWVFRDARISARFVVKCHAEDGRYACILCAQHRDVDCVCRDIEALVRHVGTMHDAVEIEGDPDISWACL
jgi:hypothetical protein